jgi:hypothetical protein
VPTDPPAGLKPLPPEEDPGRDEVIVHNHRVSNQTELVNIPVQPRNGIIEQTVQIPASVQWKRLVLRLYVHTGDTDGMGAQMLQVRQPELQPGTTGAARGFTGEPAARGFRGRRLVP